MFGGRSVSGPVAVAFDVTLMHPTGAETLTQALAAAARGALDSPHPLARQHLNMGLKCQRNRPKSVTRSLFNMLNSSNPNRKRASQKKKKSRRRKPFAVSCLQTFRRNVLIALIRRRTSERLNERTELCCVYFRYFRIALTTSNVLSAVRPLRFIFSELFLFRSPSTATEAGENRLILHVIVFC